MANLNGAIGDERTHRTVVAEQPMSTLHLHRGGTSVVLDMAAERLRRLLERGLLTEHEFEIAMDRVTGPAGTPPGSGAP